MNKRNQIFIIVALSLLIALAGHIALALACLFVAQFLIAKPRGKLCAVTLSVPEILKDILDAFKVETPEVFGPNGICQDFSSKTAVLNDKITAHISHVPVTGQYDGNNGGFKNASQDVTTLLEDVPVTLSQLPIVTVKIALLTELATKGVPLYKAAVANVGYALGKNVLDSLLFASLANVSNSFHIAPQLATLDTFEMLRDQCNGQRMLNSGRMAIINGALAGGLGSDDRVRSELFFGQKNEAEGYRVWKNVAGFSTIREYTDFPVNGLAGGLAFDKRLAVVSVRRIETVNAIVEELKIPKTMEFIQQTDAGTKLEITGVLWQEQGTGDRYISAAILFGTGVGNQGLGAGAATDNAGCVIRTQ